MPGRFANWESVGAAIAALTHPYGEIVIHDLRTGKIAAVWNAVSGRKVGSDSLLGDDFPGAGAEGRYGPYSKIGKGGEQIKTVSAVLPDDDGSPIGLLCINLDVTEAGNAIRFLASLTGVREPKPAELFKVDWRERIQELAHEAVIDLGKSIANLSRDDRIRIVERLSDEGLFETRKAVDHAAHVLGVSRTSLYNYLRDLGREARK